MHCYTLFLFLPASLAFQLPFNVPFFNNDANNIPGDEIIVGATPRIAIIGAGAGGTSAAFWISKAKERFGVDVDVDIYERELYIGGRASLITFGVMVSLT